MEPENTHDVYATLRHCVELAQKDKIKAANSWSLPLTELLDGILEESNSSPIQQFQMATQGNTPSLSL
ncbi:hypothetical protein KIPB_001383 [Kipferlia bialata]|uniref:Uncharacterized protein n=1 Tax=Kipferlia bialata TaxID=797122 RepID=A0A391NIT3_9EUKA|nr:hypothetical protein KIPB_001383 [Kipferlia bialata]|eukprot:g1383.t1